MNSRTATREENVQRACRFISRAATDGAELAVLPEMFHCEYFSHYRYMDYPAAGHRLRHFPNPRLGAERRISDIQRGG